MQSENNFLTAEVSRLTQQLMSAEKMKRKPSRKLGFDDFQSQGTFTSRLY